MNIVSGLVINRLLPIPPVPSNNRQPVLTATFIIDKVDTATEQVKTPYNKGHNKWATRTTEIPVYNLTIHQIAFGWDDDAPDTGFSGWMNKHFSSLFLSLAGALGGSMFLPGIVGGTATSAATTTADTSGSLIASDAGITSFTGESIAPEAFTLSNEAGLTALSSEGAVSAIGSGSSFLSTVSETISKVEDTIKPILNAVKAGETALKTAGTVASIFEGTRAPRKKTAAQPADSGGWNWPLIGGAALVAGLGIYAWRKR